ncbi:LLM class flavin-dependent oxidoreductase [Leucobacter allii]|uniref:LLM class flavin-dependent oxidoreductase n=1 Tax=Leucobacter allii TaxID=2932247 RepID=A0ABY4FIM8_9MICO|nr:LLM class flavin-dependent oxidoreductase [Leucobacter allii]UOQ55827.1 LLM class flavin-dependent oxidoreductase [Leucobacter allii]
MSASAPVVGLALSPTWLRGEAWREPGSRVEELFDLAPYLDLATAAEEAGLDFLFAPDAGHIDSGALERSPGFSTHDPHTLTSMLAARTRRIGVVPTVQTLVASPFAVARGLMSLHRLSGGRAGWNAVTALGGSENYGGSVHRGGSVGVDPRARDPEERRRRAAACIAAVRALWESYPYDAILADRATGRFADAARVRPIDLDDGVFRIAGPGTVAAHPDGEPPLFMAGARPEAVAGSRADAVFAAAPEAADVAAQQRGLAAAFREAGRVEAAARLLPGLVVTVDRSRAEAERLAALQDRGRGAAHWRATGTPEDVAAAILTRADALDRLPDARFDGAIVLAGGSWRSLELFCAEVVPALRSAGLLEPVPAETPFRERLVRD